MDSGSLTAARGLGLGTDSAMLDAALVALLASHRRAEIDDAYSAYDRRPIDEPDEWGDLAAFRDSVGGASKRSRRRAS